ncbi:MAG: hypothetical protein JSS83_26605 [Cyanobacteria bacterium SZAS LIN-3]|nr:hypothetical protein [Cyanobacteria bacterium SZAS LIN-3]
MVDFKAFALEIKAVLRQLRSEPRAIKAELFNEKLFWQRVSETREWCAMHLSADDLQGSLRSAELGTPSLNFSWAPSWDVRRPASEWNQLRTDEDSRRSWVDTLSDRRSKRLADAGSYPRTACEHTTAQQFLVYLPGTNLADGAAATVSRGYFDDDNIPPWDTWLMYCPAYSGEAKLISWVPPELMDLIDSAMRCNAEECLYWATVEQLFSREATME